MDAQAAAGEMLGCYLEQVAYYRLDGPIPDKWWPSEITGEAREIARRRCLEFAEAAVRDGAALDWDADRWLRAADILAAHDADDFALEFSDEPGEFGFTAKEAEAADRFMASFLDAHPLSSDDFASLWPGKAPEEAKPGARS